MTAFHSRRETKRGVVSVEEALAIRAMVYDDKRTHDLYQWAEENDLGIERHTLRALYRRYAVEKATDALINEADKGSEQ
jgi:hypothetical protein